MIKISNALFKGLVERALKELGWHIPLYEGDYETLKDSIERTGYFIGEELTEGEKRYVLSFLEEMSI